MSRALPLWAALSFALASCAVCIAPRPVRAQFDFSSEPSVTYFKAFNLYFEGNFADALEVYIENLRQGSRTVDGRWYDAICYHAMAGECHYAMGNLSLALEQYNAAVSILVADPGWTERIQFPAAIGPVQGNNRIVPPWTPADRTAIPGDFASPMQVLVGRLDNSDVARSGGVIAPPEHHLLNVAEVVRCICLSLRRRVEILGPLCQHDPFSAAIVNALDSIGGTRNHWSQSWFDVQYGLALVGAGRAGEAAAALERGVLIGGNYTHPASAGALYQLAQLLASQQHYDQAEKLFLQSSVAAAEFGQVPLVEEALHQATVMHIFHDNAQALSELAAALEWARREGLRHLMASLMIDNAENLITLGRAKEASILVSEARKARGRKTSLSVQVSARLEHQTALLAFQQQQLAAANANLNAAIKWQQAASPRLFQITTVNQWYLSRADEISSNRAADLFEELLREPDSDDWIRQTLDTLTIELTPHVPALENWMEVTLERGEIEKALLITEMIRRHRFYSTLSLGGRWLSLRWMMEAPESVLPAEARQRRRDILSRYPEYAQASSQARTLRTELQNHAMDDAVEIKKNEDNAAGQGPKKALAELARTSEIQEMMLGEIAMRREAVPYVFPPRTDVETLQDALGSRRAALIFASTTRAMHVFLVSEDGLFHWRLTNQLQLRRTISQLLRSLGLVNDNGNVTDKTLADSDWKEIASTLLSGMIDRPQYGFWKRFDEIVIVPDSYLWYLPFELLQTVDEPSNQARNLAEQTRIRYAPTAGLIVTPAGPRSRFPKTVVVQGQMSPRETPEFLNDRRLELSDVLNDVKQLPDKLPAATGLVRCFWDRLLVWDDVVDGRESPLAWSPGRIDARRPDSAISRWMQLPWGGPQQVLLPGFRSLADSGARGDADGSEIFQAVMSLMAGGSRTILISRWRTGGQSSFDLVREFLQESESLGAAAAWQRSTSLVRTSQTNPEWEPRLDVPASIELVATDHPFFWAGFALVEQADQSPPEAAEATEVEVEAITPST